MRRNVLSLVMAVAAVTAPASAQQPTAVGRTPHNETVVVTGLNPDRTVNGFISVVAHPCPTTTFNVNLNFAGAKDAEDGKAKVRSQIDEVVKQIDDAAKQCRK